MSELTDDELRGIEAALKGQLLPRMIDPAPVREMATELLALRAAASTSTEGAKPVAWIVTAQDRVDYIFGDEAKAAQHGTPRPLVELTPPASKVTTDEAEERG